MRRRQAYAEIERRKDEGHKAFLAGTLDRVTAFDPANYRMAVPPTPSTPAPALPAGPVAPVLRRRQLLPLQGDGPEGETARQAETAPLTQSSPFSTKPRVPGFCDRCNKQIGRGANFHRARCQG